MGFGGLSGGRDPRPQCLMVLSRSKPDGFSNVPWVTIHPVKGPVDASGQVQPVHVWNWDQQRWKPDRQATK